MVALVNQSGNLPANLEILKSWAAFGWSGRARRHDADAGGTPVVPGNAAVLAYIQPRTFARTMIRRTVAWHALFKATSPQGHTQSIISEPRSGAHAHAQLCEYEPWPMAVPDSARAGGAAV